MGDFLAENQQLIEDTQKDFNQEQEELREAVRASDHQAIINNIKYLRNHTGYLKKNLIKRYEFEKQAYHPTDKLLHESREQTFLQGMLMVSNPQYVQEKYEIALASDDLETASFFEKHGALILANNKYESEKFQLLVDRIQSQRISDYTYEKVELAKSLKSFEKMADKLVEEYESTGKIPRQEFFILYNLLFKDEQLSVARIDEILKK